MSGFSMDRVIGVEPVENQHPRHKGRLASIDDPGFCTAEEKKAIEKLRTRCGWWNGDWRAVQVLREFAKGVAP